jgi:hypothetical protein
MKAKVAREATRRSLARRRGIVTRARDALDGLVITACGRNRRVVGALQQKRTELVHCLAKDRNRLVHFNRFPDDGK